MESLLTIIMPLYNGELTLTDVFESILIQENKDLIKEFLVIDDNSSDKSLEIIENYKSKLPFQIKLLKKVGSPGLASSYNFALDFITTKYFLIMHQDVVLKDINAFRNILKPLLNPENKIIATTPTLLHPPYVWERYSFWQKCLFARHVDSRVHGLNEKFDCFNKELLLKHIGKFDSTSFKTAGEDIDISYRIQKSGHFVYPTDTEVVHIHDADKNYSLIKWIKKECQIAEAQGTFLRKHGIYDVKLFLKTYFRIILLLGLVVPYLNTVFALLIVAYSFLYTKLVYLKEYKNPRIFALPLINISLLFSATFYTVKGFIYKMQMIR